VAAKNNCLEKERKRMMRIFLRKETMIRDTASGRRFKKHQAKQDDE